MTIWQKFGVVGVLAFVIDYGLSVRHDPSTNAGGKSFYSPYC
ncbi:hypothetical protein [Adlercreutzia sp. ZJ138]|nr:hypothetical protein [Adlercreutzia sp. ZJ138]